MKSDHYLDGDKHPIPEVILSNDIAGGLDPDPGTSLNPDLGGGTDGK